MIKPGQSFIGTLLRVEPAGAKPNEDFVLRYDQFDLISKGLTVSVHHPSLIEVEAGDRIYVTPNRIDHDPCMASLPSKRSTSRTSVQRRASKHS